jgi:hypothetical protein
MLRTFDEKRLRAHHERLKSLSEKNEKNLNQIPILTSTTPLTVPKPSPRHTSYISQPATTINVRQPSSLKVEHKSQHTRARSTSAIPSNINETTKPIATKPLSIEHSPTLSVPVSGTGLSSNSNSRSPSPRGSMDVRGTGNSVMTALMLAVAKDALAKKTEQVNADNAEILTKSQIFPSHSSKPSNTNLSIPIRVDGNGNVTASPNSPIFKGSRPNSKRSTMQ